MECNGNLLQHPARQQRYHLSNARVCDERASLGLNHLDCDERARERLLRPLVSRCSYCAQSPSLASACPFYYCLDVMDVFNVSYRFLITYTVYICIYELVGFPTIMLDTNKGIHNNVN